MDRIIKYALIGLFLLMGSLIALYMSVAGSSSDRIHDKSARVMAGINTVLEQGGDVTDVLNLLNAVQLSLGMGDAAGAEKSLDEALTILGPAGAVDPALIKPPQLPLYAEPEQEIALFGAPARVQIVGYYGSALNPFLSADGEYLFFNNESGPQVATTLFYARKEDDRGTLFQFIGAVPGIHPPGTDMSASLDAEGRFYFTSLREYNRNLSALYTGRFSGQGVTGVKAMPGDFAAPQPGLISMDGQISRDGDAFYYTRSRFLFGQQIPLQSDVAVAYLTEGEYLPFMQADALLAGVNTAALEYGPSVTGDELELYFTRASRVRSAEGKESDYYRVMVANRAARNQPFSTAYAISSIKGKDVGGPYIVPDGTAIYFHGSDGSKHLIYRAQRRN